MIEEISLTEQECLVCDRVGAQTFYRELREHGVPADKVREVLKLLVWIYLRDHTIFAGRPRSTIKAAVSYIALGRQGFSVSQRILSEYFDINVGTLRAMVKQIFERFPDDDLHHFRMEKGVSDWIENPSAIVR